MHLRCWANQRAQSYVQGTCTILCRGAYSLLTEIEKPKYALRKRVLPHLRSQNTVLWGLLTIGMVASEMFYSEVSYHGGMNRDCMGGTLYIMIIALLRRELHVQEHEGRFQGV